MKDGDFDRLRIPLDDEADPPTSNDERADVQQMASGASPAQLAAGSAILAGLILVGVAAFRRRGRSGPGEAGGSG